MWPLKRMFRPLPTPFNTPVASLSSSTPTSSKPTPLIFVATTSAAAASSQLGLGTLMSSWRNEMASSWCSSTLAEISLSETILSFRIMPVTLLSST